MTTQSGGTLFDPAPESKPRKRSGGPPPDCPGDMSGASFDWWWQQWAETSAETKRGRR